MAVAYGAAAAKFGSSLSHSQIDERFRRAFGAQEAIDAGAGGWRTDEARELGRWQNIVAEVFDDVTEQSAIFDELWRHFAQPAHWRLFDDVEDTWNALVARGLTLGIASNFDGRLRQVCSGLPPLDRCQHILVSSELGARKPSPDVFSQTESLLQVAPEQILLVGDDWSNDYLAAQAAGWQAIFLDRTGVRPDVPNSIRSLRELVVC